jgi:hypothetical protein
LFHLNLLKTHKKFINAGKSRRLTIRENNRMIGLIFDKKPVSRFEKKRIEGINTGLSRISNIRACEYEDCPEIPAINL